MRQQVADDDVVAVSHWPSVSCTFNFTSHYDSGCMSDSTIDNRQQYFTQRCGLCQCVLLLTQITRAELSHGPGSAKATRAAAARCRCTPTVRYDTDAGPTRTELASLPATD